MNHVCIVYAHISVFYNDDAFYSLSFSVFSRISTMSTYYLQTALKILKHFTLKIQINMILIWL
jgi:hypothetical protein